MKQSIALFLFCVCFFAGFVVHAQDQLFLRNVKDPIKVKVYEIGLDEIKYKPWGDTIIPVLVLPRASVRMLVLSNGSVYEFSENPMMEAVNYADQHNNALKFSFLSPLYGNMAFSYERSIKPGNSIEVGIAAIGLGVEYEKHNLGGMYGRVGYKFITSPDHYVRGMKYSHILKGGYVKPEVVFGGYAFDRSYYSYSYSSGYGASVDRYKVKFGGVLVNFGKQWVFNDAFVFDMYFGVGYGFANAGSNSNRNSLFYDDPILYHYAFLGGVREFPLALTAGLKMGFVFGHQPPASRNIPAKK